MSNGKPWPVCSDERCKQRAFYRAEADIDDGQYSRLPAALAESADRSARDSCIKHLVATMDSILDKWGSARVSRL